MNTTSNPLQSRFEEQIELLKALCDCYDQGKEVLSLSIATSIRVLVHDTNASRSVLAQIGRKTGQFLSTNFRDPRELIHLGLVRRINVGVKDGAGGEAKYWPLCDERYFSSPEQSRLLPFEDWWAEQVFQNLQYHLTRRDLVLAVVNKDGGAHVDHEVEERYDQFRKACSGGSTLVGINSGAKRGYDNIPTYPAIRQIAHELRRSIQVEKA